MKKQTTLKNLLNPPYYYDKKYLSIMDSNGCEFISRITFLWAKNPDEKTDAGDFVAAALNDKYKRDFGEK